MKKHFLVFLFTLLFLWPALFPTQGSATVLRGIQTEGNTLVSSTFVVNATGLTLGREYSDSDIALAIKNIYNTDYFSRVNATWERSGLLTFVLKENPVVDTVEIEGNKEIKSEALLRSLGLAPHVILSSRKLMVDTKNIRDQYVARGYIQVLVSHRIIKLPHNRVKVLFLVEENHKSMIDDIQFVGNHIFSDHRLKSVIMSREHRWWKIFTNNDNYNSTRIAYDGELLRKFYQNNGYMDFHLLSSYVTITKENRYVLTFNVSEGAHYKFAKLSLDIVPDRIKPYKNVLTKQLDISDIWFNQDDVEGIVHNLTKVLNAELNFQSVEVTSAWQENELLKTVAVTFKVTEVPKKIIEHINIIGNTKTYEKVVRRALSIREGDVFTPQTVRDTTTDVYNLGYFGSNISVRPKIGSSLDKVDLDINVKENSTGFISLSGGYSTYEGFMIEGSFSESNLLGSGDGLKVSLSFSQKATNFSIGLSDPYFLDKKIYASAEVFNTLTDYTSTSFYKINNLGLRFSIGYNLSENLTQNFSYSVAQENILPSRGAPEEIRANAGSRLSSILSHTLQYDRRDNVIYPTKGYVLSVNTDLAGLGGDVYYLRNTLQATGFAPLYDKIVLSVLGSGGYINKIRPNVPIAVSDKFFIGGNSLRGFAYSGIGPRDPRTGSALGGNLMMRLSAQVDIPIPIVDNYGLLFHIFNDNATIYNVGKLQVDVVDKSLELRSSVGFGLTWRSPFGIITLDWGWPVVQQPQDITQRFLLSFGTRV